MTTSSGSDYDYRFKVLIIGSSAVGKSSLMMQYTESAFRDTHIPTIGVDFKVKRIELDDKLVVLQIWDTAGQERFRNITSAFYRGANGIIIVYDVTNRDSFENVETWFRQVEHYANDNTSRLLIANKCDLSTERKVEFSEGQSLAKRLGVTYLETSAKDATNVEMAFITMAAEIKCRYTTEELESLAKDGNLKLGKAKPRLAEKLGVSFLETSAKDSTNVEVAFTTMAADIKSRYTTEELVSLGQEVSLKLGKTTPVCNNPGYYRPCC